MPSDDDDYSPGSDEESEEDKGYNQQLWECADQYEKDPGAPSVFQDDPGIKATDPEKLNQEFSLKRTLVSHAGCSEGKESGEMKKGKRRKVAVVEEKEFKCDICTKSFERKHSLVIHLRVHTGERYREPNLFILSVIFLHCIL